MRWMRQARWFLLALLLPLIPATQARAGVFISVGFAPPVLPVYVQPPCPAPNLIWTPGYWAYGDDGYYWVPGAWVPAPYEGALWTPPYWGWQSGIYVFHPGYWGWHVGYYGGVNYGYGYMGVGFVGGMWRGREFAYNTAVMHVDDHIVRNVYVDRRIVERDTIVNERRVAYAGGPGGIRHEPTGEERVAMREQHLAPTQAQQQRMVAARSDRASYFAANHGRPQQLAMARPLPAERSTAPAMGGARNGFAQRTPQANQNGGYRGGSAPAGRPAAPQYQRPAPQYQQQPRQYQQQPRYNQQQPRYNQQQPRQYQQQPRYNQQQPHYNQQRPAQGNRPEALGRPQARPEARPRPEPREPRR